MTIANYITLLRILLTPFFFVSLLTFNEHHEDKYRWMALAFFLVAVATDALDGLIARAFKKKSTLGQFLDPLADKLLLLSGYLGLLFVQSLALRPPLWVTVTIVFRDLVILSGLIVIFLMTGKVRVQPNRLGKCTTALQMATLVAILLGLPVSVFLWNLTAFLTIVSCFTYVGRELKLIKQSA